MPGEKLSDDWTHESPKITAAYRICLEADEHLQRAQAVPLVGVKNAERALVNIRVLGYLLVLGPTDTAREHVASMIVKAKDLTSLIDLGEHYEKRFLRPFRRDRGCTPDDSLDSRRFSDSTLAAAASTIKPRPADHLEARKSTLVRDNHSTLKFTRPFRTCLPALYGPYGTRKPYATTHSTPWWEGDASGLAFAVIR